MDDTTIITQNIAKASPHEFYVVKADGIYGGWVNGAAINEILMMPRETFIKAYKTYILGNTETEK